MATRIVMDAGGMSRLHAEVDRQMTHPITDEVASDMRRYVPVLSGDLHDTIEPEYGRGFGRVYVGGGKKNVTYWGYQEYGTSRMSAQPYARPAIFQAR